MISREVLEEYKNKIKANKRAINKLPAGRLAFAENPKRYYQIIEKDGIVSKRGITKNVSLIEQLVYKKVLLEFNKEYERVLKASSSNAYGVEPVTLDVVLGKLKSPYLGFDLKVYDPNLKAASQWEKEDFNVNPMNGEMREFLTDTGVAVRSKSERTIANMLTKLGLQYRYEAELKVKMEVNRNLGGTKVIDKVFYPDFTVYNSKIDKVFYIEHLGLARDKDYMVHNLDKLKVYINSESLIMDDNLILTFESELVDLNVFEQVLRIKLCV